MIHIFSCSWSPSHLKFNFCIQTGFYLFYLLRKEKKKPGTLRSFPEDHHQISVIPSILTHKYDDETCQPDGTVTCKKRWVDLWHQWLPFSGPITAQTEEPSGAHGGWMWSWFILTTFKRWHIISDAHAYYDSCRCYECAAFFKHLRDRRFNICGISYGLTLHSPTCLYCLWCAMRWYI